jgi:hypothetical protein
MSDAEWQVIEPALPPPAWKAGKGGRPAIKAQFEAIYGSPAVDGAAGFLIADLWRVRMVAERSGTFFGVHMTAGEIYTVAGTGSFGFSGDGGPATKAEITDNAVTIDSAGNLVISDQQSYQIRVVAASSGTFYGIPMTAGDIYTVAGGGSGGLGDGRPGTKATISYVDGLAAPGADVVFSDLFNERVRELTR